MAALTRSRTSTRRKSMRLRAIEMRRGRKAALGPPASPFLRTCCPRPRAPYQFHEQILNCLVELEMPLPEIIARGHPPELVKKVERMLYLAEYKRRQAAPGVNIPPKHFGRDRRYPITNKFREKLSS